ncbi:uncharacterized protein [Diadema antillarum]|uniref:uncharacterized protein n=1 Tax=Diadema antillarum TaxID=105358 RepID=UPI003A846C98
MGDNPGLPPLLPRPGSGGGSVAISRYQPSLFCGDQGESMSIIGQDIFAAPELPEIVELLTRGIPSRTTIADMIGLCRTTVQDIERLPAIHPSVMSSRGEQNTRYMSFVSPPPIETRPPRGRVKYPRKLLGPEECYKCQLRTEHSNCEKHKFLRIGGGYRHSYAYIKQIMDAIAKEQYDIARVEFLKQEQIRIEEQRKIEQEKNKVKRRVKVFLRTKSGNVITRYQFFNEDDYREMKSDKALARRMLGLDDADSLEDFVASKDDYVLDEDGEMVKAKKKKRKKKGRHKSRDREEETEEESADEVFDSDGDQDRRRQRREKKRRSKRHRRSRERSSDGVSVSESGVGASIVGDDRDSRSEKSKRRRRHRHGSDEGNDVDIDVDGRRSVQSYISENGTHHEAIRHREKKRHKRRDDSREGDRSRHHRRKRRDDGENADGGESRLSDSASDEGEDGHGHHRDRRRHRHPTIAKTTLTALIEVIGLGGIDVDIDVMAEAITTAMKTVNVGGTGVDRRVEEVTEIIVVESERTMTG